MDKLGHIRQNHMQTGLTDAPSSLEIYVCGPQLAGNPPPHPHTPTLTLTLTLSLLNTLFLTTHFFFLLSKFEISRHPKKGQTHSPLWFSSRQNYHSCPAPLTALLHPSPFFEFTLSLQRSWIQISRLKFHILFICIKVGLGELSLYHLAEIRFVST